MIFVTGAAGMVGSYLTQVFPASELYLTDMSASGHGIEPLDTRNREAVMESIARVKPATVLHLAAETDVDRCEREPDHAFRSNAISTLNVALACAEHNASMMYISTAGVFDGTKSSPYTEFDQPTPVTVYGKAKYEGEQFVQEICTRWYIVRAGWMFGGGSRDKKFVGKIAGKCLENAPEIHCVDDKFGSPTFAKDLLDTVKLLLDHRLYGLYHGVNRGWCSRYQVAVEIARYLGANTKIVPVSSADFQLSAPRPVSEAAISYKLDLMGLNFARTWTDALHDYLATWKNEKTMAACS